MNRTPLPVLAALLCSVAAPGAATIGEPESTLLINGSFELLEAGAPVGWEIAEGARSASGTKTSEWFYGGPGHTGARCLKLAGDAQTGTWMMLRSSPVPVEPGRLLRLSGWIRTQDVRRELRQWSNANVGLAFEKEDGAPAAVDGYPVAATPPLEGSHAWRRMERVVRVPDGAATVRAICFLSMSGTAWFDDVAIEAVPEPEWELVETPRFRFHEQAGARLTPAERAENERHLAELEELLALKLPHPVRYYRYLDEEQKERITGRGGAAHAELPGRLHSTRATDRHELVHLLTALVGPAESVLLGEGIAVHLAGKHEGRGLDEQVRELAAANRLPRLPVLADWSGFAGVDESVSYPVAGSFVRFLVETGGLGAFKQLYPRHGTSSSVETLDARLKERYGAGLAELEARWRAAVVGD